MKLFTDSANVGGKYITIADRGDIRHMLRVLRLGEGDVVEVSDSVRWEYTARIISAEEERVLLQIMDKQAFAREPELEVTLFQGIPKAGKMESIIQKCVELGVSAVVPVFMERTVVVDKGNFRKKLDRWQKISDEAVKQCKRGRVPLIEDPISSSEAVQKTDDFDLVLLPYENERNYTIKDHLRSLSEKPKSVAVIIGPEGGFSDREAAEFTDRGAVSVTLGKTVLRTETAGMAALAMIMYELEL